MIILSHITAFEFWRQSPRVPSKRVTLHAARELKNDEPRTAIRHEDDLLLPLLEANVDIQGFSLPIHLTESSGRHAPSTPAIRAHSFLQYEQNTARPTPSYVRLDSGLYVSSPEQCFLELASLLDAANLAIAGSELCGSFYRLGEDLLERDLITTPEDIAAHLDRYGNIRGIKRARRASRHLFANAKSPAEFLLAIHLCLPYMMGGYGCPKPQLNPEIPLGRHGGKLIRKHRLIPDLYWEDARLDVEYKGWKHHARPSDLANDAERLNVLGHLGICVMDVTRDQFASLERMDSVASTVCRHLGKRYRPRSAKHEIERRYLHTKIQHYLKTGLFDQAGLYAQQAECR